MSNLLHRLHSQKGLMCVRYWWTCSVSGPRLFRITLVLNSSVTSDLRPSNRLDPSIHFPIYKRRLVHLIPRIVQLGLEADHHSSNHSSGVMSRTSIMECNGAPVASTASVLARLHWRQCRRVLRAFTYTVRRGRGRVGFLRNELFEIQEKI